MTTLEDRTKKRAEPSAEAAELVRLAKEQGLSLTGPDGLLEQFTTTNRPIYAAIGVSLDGHRDVLELRSGTER